MAYVIGNRTLFSLKPPLFIANGREKCAEEFIRGFLFSDENRRRTGGAAKNRQLQKNDDCAGRRASSLGSLSARILRQKFLKNGLDKNDTAAAVKRVKWADEWGGDLVSIIDIANNNDQDDHFDQEEYSDNVDQNRQIDDEMTSPTEKDCSKLDDGHFVPAKIIGQNRSRWALTFRSPAYNYAKFRSQLEKSNISLEYVVLLNKSRQPRLLGTIKVKNLSYEKDIFLRLSSDDWSSYSDLAARYKPFDNKMQIFQGYYPNSSPMILDSYQVNYLDYKPRRRDSAEIYQPKNYDTFDFEIDMQIFDQDQEKNRNVECKKIEFCLCYRILGDGREFWDNNSGANYTLVRQNQNLDVANNKKIIESRSGLRISSHTFDKQSNDNNYNNKDQLIVKPLDNNEGDDSVFDTLNVTL